MRQVAYYTGILSRIGLWGAGVGLVAMTAMIFAQVIWRYVLNNSLVWSEPASVMTMGWFIFLGAAVGIREGYHLSFEVLLYVLPDAVNTVLNYVSDVVVAAFGIGMIWYGAQLVERTAGNDIPSLGISGAFDFLPLVAGGLLVVVFSLERLARRAAGLPLSSFGERAEH